MIWLKLLHFAAIAIWSAGLISLPSLYVRRAQVPDDESRHRLQALVRFFYVVIISPAAFVAVASGTALIFLRAAFEPWFSLKLLLVGAMVLLHVLTCLIIIRLFEVGKTYPLWRSAAATTLNSAIVGSILLVVLAKPDLPNLMPEILNEPGGLKRLAADLNPFQR